MKDKTFDNWDDALAYANKLYNDGDISRKEIDKIARAAFTGSKGSKLDRMSSEQLAKLAKLVAAEKVKRHGNKSKGLSDDEFSELTGLAAVKKEKTK